MVPTGSNDQQSGSVTLDPALNMAAASSLYLSLNDKKSSDITVDASLVRHVGGQCIAILLSAYDYWTANDRKFTILNPSSVFMDSLTLLGVEPNRLGLNGDAQ